MLMTSNGFVSVFVLFIIEMFISICFSKKAMHPSFIVRCSLPYVTCSVHLFVYTIVYSYNLTFRCDLYLFVYSIIDIDIILTYGVFILV